ncbi:hypothetical protein K7X08_020069 [Anisodus acutangulus]|uniref:Uncharacterized protein n=1 Tax=Anisodus acutangulus TaxID=402998 RepID=A0A9Q1M6B7_9SOLA|nr:hypothetical protein K7X08_020069 [Anisodus acutangulus]
MKSDKKSKKRKKNVRTHSLRATKADVKAVECDISFKEEKLSSVGTRKERDNAKMETKTPRESEDSDINRKKERGDGKHPGKSSKDGHEDAVKKSETQENKVVETLNEGSDGNLIDEVKRKKSKKEKRKKEDEHVYIVIGVNQGGVSTIEEIEDSKTENANIRKKKKTKSGHSFEDLTHEMSEKERFSGHVQVFPSSSVPSDELYEVEEEK